MYCRTETSWSYWSRGEANCLSRLSWMETGSWTTLDYIGILVPPNQNYYRMSPRVWCA